MSRARTVKKKRKSSISSASRLNLIKSDSQSLLEGASVTRVSTVQEGNENDSDDEKSDGTNIVPAINMDS